MNVSLKSTFWITPCVQSVATTSDVCFSEARPFAVVLFATNRREFRTVSVCSTTTTAATVFVTRRGAIVTQLLSRRHNNVIILFGIARHSDRKTPCVCARQLSRGGCRGRKNEGLVSAHTHTTLGGDVSVYFKGVPKAKACQS